MNRLTFPIDGGCASDVINYVTLTFPIEVVQVNRLTFPIDRGCASDVINCVTDSHSQYAIEVVQVMSNDVIKL